MKATTLILSALVLAGCQTKSIRSVETEYRRVHAGMDRAELVAQLGRPDRDNHRGDLTWKYGSGIGETSSFVQLDVHLDAQGRVATQRVWRGTDRFPETHEAGALSPQVMPSER